MTVLPLHLVDDWARVLADRYESRPAEDVLAEVIHDIFPGRIALVSSFGAESAVLLHMVARIAPELPVIFVDTGRLFGETLRYRDRLQRILGLENIITVTPDPVRLAAEDPRETLFRTNPDRCCFLRKVLPLEDALAPFSAWISGRKRYQGADRARLPRVEAVDGRIKINPLADWSRADVAAYFAAHDLLRHPLEADGYVSIGCMPCTDRLRPGDADVRAGRWRGREKTECGIHLPRAEAARRAGLDIAS